MKITQVALRTSLVVAIVFTLEAVTSAPANAFAGIHFHLLNLKKACSWRGQAFQIKFFESCDPHYARRDAEANAANEAKRVAACRKTAAQKILEARGRASDVVRMYALLPASTIGDLLSRDALLSVVKGIEGATAAGAVARDAICASPTNAEHKEASDLLAKSEKLRDEAQRVYRAVEAALKTRATFDQEVENLRIDSLDVMRLARGIVDRAPKALEAYGGYEGGPKEKMQKALSLIRYKLAHAFRLIKVLQNFHAAGLSPLDEGGFKVVVAAYEGKGITEEPGEVFRAAVTEGEIDKELDNLSLAQLGVKGSGNDPETDPKNLETPFDKAKDTLARFQRNGDRYVGAVEKALLPAHQEKVGAIKAKWKESIGFAKTGLRLFIDAITESQRAQSGAAGGGR